MYKTLFATGLLFCLAACGQKGPLILPSEAEAPISQQGEKAEDKSAKQKQSSNK